MSNLVDKAMELQVMTCLDSLLNRANHDEYLQRIGKKEALRFLEENSKYADIIKSNLQRLESIDNANPSEALECVEEFIEDNKNSIEVSKANNYKTDYLEIKKKKLIIIKQALLKAEKEHNSVNLLMQELDCKDFAELRKYARCGYQTFRNAKGANYDNIIIDEAQEPKQYLKWEDLEFDHKPKYIDVKMGDNKYLLIVGFSDGGNEMAILQTKLRRYYFVESEDNKQFFNDLHLERVEE